MLCCEFCQHSSRSVERFLLPLAVATLSASLLCAPDNNAVSICTSEVDIASGDGEYRGLGQRCVLAQTSARYGALLRALTSLALPRQPVPRLNITSLW